MLVEELFFETLFNRPGELGSDYLGYIELRCIYPEKAVTNGLKPITVDYMTSTKDAASLARQRRDQGYDVYTGVLPRSVKRGTSDSVLLAGALWADYDFKDGRSHRTLAYALDALPGHLRAPSMVVGSGTGVHLYWLLDKAVTALQGEHNNKLIAKALDADATHDRARILRVPGTINHKRGEMRPVSLIKLDPLTKVAARLLTPAPHRVEAQRFHRRIAENELQELSKTPVDLSRLSPLWVRYITEGIASDRYNYYQNDRSRLDFRVIKELVNQDYSEAEIISIFTNPDYAISEKTMEMSPDQRANYLYRTIDKVIDSSKKEPVYA